LKNIILNAYSTCSRGTLKWKCNEVELQNGGHPVFIYQIDFSESSLSNMKSGIIDVLFSIQYNYIKN